MYNNYFGFSTSPFENNLDQRFLFFSANHKEIIAALLYFIKWKKGFALVCGDVGTGKTMLINYLLNKLPASVHPIMIANPDVGYNEILRYIAGKLKIDAKGKKVLDLVDHVKAALVEASRQGKRFVLIIDEAHLLPDKSIEQIRLLSNIETQEHKLFQILLLGQYELSYKLNRPEMRQLLQRININRFLAPMDAEETIQYIDHRLKLAGASFDACFEPHCRQLIFKMTNGVPRSINQLCDSALLICMAEKLPKVNRKVLKKAGMALRSDILFTPRSRSGRTAFSWKTGRVLAVLCACAIIVILLGIFGHQGGLGKRAQHFLYRLHSSMLTPPVAVREPIPETAENPGMPTIEMESSGQKMPENKDQSSGSGAVLSAMNKTLQTKPSGLSGEKTENEHRSPPPAEKGTLSEKQDPLLLNPNPIAVQQQKPITKTAANPGILTSEMQSSGQKTPENKDQSSDFGAALPAMKQPLQTEVLAPPGEKTGNGSPQSPGNDLPPGNQASIPIRVMVKNGDTLIGIASRFFPESKLNGILKILAANPFIEDMDRIYTGQELIIPEAGSYRKDPN